MTRERALSFGSVAELYDRYRPAPPEQLAVVLGPLGDRDVLEIAAGTGLCSRFLLSLGARLSVVEPDDDMRAVLCARSPQVRAFAAHAESLPFADSSFDVVVTSSAWHWFRQPDALNEVARVLRDQGELWVLGNGFNREQSWLVDLVGLRERDGNVPGAQRAHELDFAGDERFSAQRRVTLDWSWTRDVESLVQLFHTYSGVIGRSDEELRVLDDQVRARVLALAPKGVLEVPMAVRGTLVTRVR
ncbi:MAG TPA: class I SAM-dependent methyltransferase [Acidimicrobiales bacterium]|nr:class I SAM-dependent methyltransferase [Acidimicrobiales bacterium]